ncbi:hypothetical protein GCM10011391_25900 [Pullulanibacillus camelliae]|uniref:DinB-like domain-containing protein n=1 Tax=Pullulanibacillus camelliae TaxID=1707096 RepID=A0A8J2YIV0_9BACL|nr:DinB family protein [Pullulanibacillus camelliae]GGE45865.1 hypothetical protein GCM10011391_25900 [Pullulanibacillus camelliae]
MLERPREDEYNSFYRRYIDLVPDDFNNTILEEQVNTTIALVKELTEEQALFRYEPEKWTIKEVIGHMTDTERIMAYRLLSVARGEKVELPGFDQDDYVKKADFNERALSELLDDLKVVRASTLRLIKGIDNAPDVWLRTGTANGSPLTVCAIAYIIAGHERHHQQLLQERYGLR